MKQFSISFRLGKPSAPHGANLAHNNREFSAANIDPARSDRNIFFTAESISDAYDALFSEALEAFNAKQDRPARRIEDYYAHIAGGKREEPFYEVIVQFGDSKNAPCGSPRGELAREMLIEYMESFQKRNPNLHIFNAVLHMDEASPHLHIDFIPFYTKGRQRGLSKGVSMKSALMEMGFAARSKYASPVIGWEESERMAMEQILQRRGLLREDKQAHYAHMTVEDYKRSQDAKQMTKLLRQSHRIMPDTVAENLRRQLAEQSARTETLEREKRSPYRAFFYSDAEKQAFVQAQLDQRGIPYRETDTGFEAQQCFRDEIRKIEKQYKVPALNIREQMREDIDHFALFAGNFEELLERMRKANYEIKRGKYLAARPQYGTNFIRFRSLGERYTEEALKRRIVYLSQYERFFQNELPKVRERRAPNQVVLETMAFYMRTVREGKIRLRRMDKTRPFIWKNDPEMNALLHLNKMINDGATLASIRKEFADKEQAVLHLREKLEKSRSDLKSFIVLQEKCEIVFGLRYSEKYTHEQAAETLKGYPSINAGNWKRVYDLVADEKKTAEDLQSRLAQAEAELKEAAEIAGIAERVFGTTFVQDAIHRRNCEQVGDCLPNGSFTPDGFYRR